MEPANTGMHPDGAIYPAHRHRAGDILDGLSHTIIIMETIDSSGSCWMLGSECTLTGLPGQGSPMPSVPTASTTPVPGANIAAV